MHRRLALGLLLSSLPACYGRVATRIDASVSDVPAPQDLAADASSDGASGDAAPGPTLPGGDCDPLDPSECALPWPSNHYLRADPTRRTGYTLTFGATSMPANLAESHADPASLRVLDGYGVGTPILVHFPNIDVSAMADEEHIERSLAADAPVMLFEVANNTLRRVPYWVELDNVAWEPNVSERVLFVRPAVILKEATRYVVAFRNLRTTAGAAIAPSAAFVKLRDRTAMADPALAPRVARFEEMFTLLTAAGVAREGLTLAWDWNTASSDALHGRLLRMRDEALRVAGDRGPELFISKVTRYGRPGSDAGATDPHIALAIEGDIRVPNFMRSRRAGGFEVFEIVTDANGRPTINSAEPDDPLHFWIRIPHSALSGTPHGLVQYGHGLLGSAEEVEAGYNGQIANDHNLIFFASNLVGFAEEDVGAVLSSVRDVGNFQYVAQRQHQGLVNWAVLARAVRARLGDIPEVRAAGVQVNRDELFYSGISQGGIFGATYLAISPDISRGHLGVPGINYNLLLRRSVDFDGYGNMIRAQYPRSRHQALGLAYIQLHWDATDPVSYVRHITAEPFPGNAPHHGLWAPARGDYQVSVMSNEIAARSDLGLALMANYDRDRTPWGITPQAYPHRGSGVVLYSYNNPWPALGNHPPTRDSLGDPHGRPRREAWHQRQMVTFFRTGEIIDVCGGNGCTPD
jgi:hypothetical protein